MDGIWMRSDWKSEDMRRPEASTLLLLKFLSQLFVKFLAQLLICNPKLAQLLTEVFVLLRQLLLLLPQVLVLLLQFLILLLKSLHRLETHFDNVFVDGDGFAEVYSARRFGGCRVSKLLG
jgi:hypothetical protein